MQSQKVLEFSDAPSYGAIQWVKLEQHQENKLLSNTGQWGWVGTMLKVSVEWNHWEANWALQCCYCDEADELGEQNAEDDPCLVGQWRFCED